jgi:nitroreductase
MPEKTIHDLIRRRWSPRSFSARVVEPEKLEQLLEAARWASSAANEQPWRFIIATKDQPEEFAMIAGTLMELNAVWAEKAPVLMIALAKLHFSHNEKTNRHALYDVGQAVATLALAATDLGLSLHQMGGFYPDKVREVFQLSDDYEPVAAIAIGYLGAPEELPEALRLRETATRTRKPISELVLPSPAPLLLDGVLENQGV